MNPKPLLIAECHFDTLIIEIITWWKRKDFDHESGSKLFNAMKQRYDDNKGVTVGFFDKNKKLKENIDIQKFKVAQEMQGIQWLKNPEIPDQHIFYLKDGAEQWLLDAARDAEILPVSYNIPEKLDEFTYRTKKPTIREDNDMYRFIKAVVRKNPPQIQTLRKYITDVFGEQYQFNSFE